MHYSALKKAAICAAVAAIAASICGAAAAEATRHYDIMEFDRPAQGRDAAFNTWLDEQYIPALLAVPGVVTAQRLHIDRGQTPDGPPYVTIFGVETADLDATRAAIAQRARNIPQTDTVDTASTITAIFSPLGPTVMAKDLPGISPPAPVPGKTELRTYYLFAHLNVAEGHDEEFNTFYNETHRPDVLRNPGMVWGARSKLVAIEPAGTVFPGYLAAYEFQSYDLDGSIAEVIRRLRTGITRPFPKGSFGKGVLNFYLSPIGPVRHAN